MSTRWILSCGCVALYCVTLAANHAAAQWGGMYPISPFNSGMQMLYGEAEILRAQGAVAKDTAEAANLNADTYDKTLDNEMQRIEYYFKAKELNAYARAKLQSPPLSAEAHYRINSSRKQPRLSEGDLDRYGVLFWPPLLKQEIFAQERTRLDNLFAERAEGSEGLGSPIHREIREAAAELKQALADRVTEYGSQEYLQASNFVDRIAKEAQFPVYQQVPVNVASK